MTNEEKQELKDLLFNSANNIEDEGLLTFAKRTLTGDRQQAKIAHVSDLIEKL